MNRNNNAVTDFLALVIVMVLFFLIAGIFVSDEDDSRSECIKSSCDRYCSEGSLYCYLHKPSSNTKKYNTNSVSSSGSSNSYKPSSNFGSSNKPSSSSSISSGYNSHNSYDDGYNAIYEDDDYDWDRYYEDDDYATGVDDAMDEWNDEYGEEW